MTLRGEVPVEQLHAGDGALTLSGEGAPLKPVVAAEQPIVDLAAHPVPDQVVPIRVLAGAVEPSMPIRDLVLAPGHALALEGGQGGRVLVPALHLADGATILREAAMGLATYVRVALEAHDILMAEGMAAEAAVAVPPAPEIVPLRGVAPPPDLSPVARDAPCAPMLFGADAAKLHARLLARVESLGHALTRDPALEVLTGEDALAPLQAEGGEYVYLLPSGTAALRRRSRSCIPMELDPACGDPRRPGRGAGRAAPRWHDHHARQPGFGRRFPAARSRRRPALDHRQRPAAPTPGGA
ncbi:MAG TPA: Hint domain-containing protein [Acetobacteraceae bacterium]|jgi:hypothetical protein